MFFCSWGKSSILNEELYHRVRFGILKQLLGIRIKVILRGSKICSKMHFKWQSFPSKVKHGYIFTTVAKLARLKYGRFLLLIRFLPFFRFQVLKFCQKVDTSSKRKMLLWNKNPPYISCVSYNLTKNQRFKEKSYTAKIVALVVLIISLFKFQALKIIFIPDGVWKIVF